VLGPVTGLTQTGQVSPQTSFDWNADPEADFYLVGVDGATPTQILADAATVTAPAGQHTLGVAPGLNPTPATTLAFTVPGPPPPPPGSGSDLVPILAGVGVLGIAAVALSKGKFTMRSTRRRR
jgi:hypothetical protein